jgi:AbrB family looped-hinge helix DNA binding protein
MDGNREDRGRRSVRRTVKLRQRGTITLPAEARLQLGVEEGDELAILIDPAGRLILTPLVRIPRDAGWFFTVGWQRRINEAEADLAFDRYRDLDSIDDLFAELGE